MSYTPTTPAKKKMTIKWETGAPHSTSPQAPAGSWERHLPPKQRNGREKLGSLSPLHTLAHSSHHKTNFLGFPASPAQAPASFVCIPVFLGPRSGARPCSLGPESTLRRLDYFFFLSFLPLRNAVSPLCLPPGSPFLAGGQFLRVREALLGSCWEPWRRGSWAGAGGTGGKCLRPL